MLRKSIIVIALGLLLAAPAAARRDIDGTMWISPVQFVLNHVGDCVVIHTEIQLSEVNSNSLKLYGEGGSYITPYLVKSDLRGNLVAIFSPDDFKTIIVVPSTDLRLDGYYTDGTAFSLYGTVRVK